MILKFFIMISPIGIKNAELYIKQYSKDSDKLILVNASNFPYDKNLWDDVIKSKDFSYDSDHANLFAKLYYQFKKGYMSKKVLHEIVRKLKNNTHDKVEFFFQNLEDPLSNFVFFKKAGPLKITPSVIEEGMANYYDYYHEFPERKEKLRLKKLFFSLIGLPFEIPETLIGHNYKEISHFYVKNPDLSLVPSKSLVIEDEQLNYKPDPMKILIIGQEGYSNVYGRSRYNDELLSLLKDVKSEFKNHKITYKMHWNSNVDISELLAMSEFQDVSINKNKASIESIISDLSPSVIISFTSSALVNLRLMAKGELNSSILFFYRNSFDSPRIILELYEKIGINPF